MIERPRPWPGIRLGLLLATWLVLAAGPQAAAKLDSKAWKEAEARFQQLFGQRGFPHEKLELLGTIAQDDTPRAWRLMAEGLFQEVQLWWQIRKELAEASKEHGEILQRGIKGFTADDENRVHDLQAKMKALDVELAVENEALEGVVRLVSTGPEALRANIIKRAKAGGEWAYRAAAVRVAVATMGEKGSWSFLQNAIERDKDARVRLEGLHAIGSAEEKWENLVIGRLGDEDWSVVLMAVTIIRKRELHDAVPHLINALDGAAPRVTVAIGEALHELTGENFEPYADVWGKWWDEHKDEFRSSVAVKKSKREEFEFIDFYGVPIKSDRVLFIIDISSSMKLPTKNDNPLERWKPAPPTTGGGRRPPPPPPPEEILSGPKIDVAKHELKKAIKKLTKASFFNIIAFNQAAVHWKQAMTPATDKNKEDAYKWLRALKPHGSTYIDGALRLGFRIAGLIDVDKRYTSVEVDTILFVSDGAPTDNSFPVSKKMDPEVILEHVRTWNRQKTVVIHAIGVDMVEGIEFMQKLAAQNGGIYVDR